MDSFWEDRALAKARDAYKSRMTHTAIRYRKEKQAPRGAREDIWETLDRFSGRVR